MAFPRLNAFSFWITALRRLAAVLQLHRRQRPVRRRQRARRRLVRLCSADRARLLAAATAPTTGRSSLLVSRLRQHRHRDQHHRHHPLHALPGHDAGPHAALRLALPGHVAAWCSSRSARSPPRRSCCCSIAISAAHFFDTQAGGSAVLWMHFFWIFGHPEVYILVLPAFAIVNEIIPVFSRKAIFGYPVDGRGNGRHRLRQPERVGASHVHRRHDLAREHLLRALHDGRSAFRPASRSSTGSPRCGAARFASRRRCCSASASCSSS